ncbi:MAG: hypothetical protein EBS89_13560, partial [Proteobacteria bacterium]|nr:hypothetical protein [Pseudomonadota bacterium]
RSGVVVKGAEYDRLRMEFLRADGDPDACPFDTDDYTYQGPTMATVGGRTVIVSSEFTPEAER